MGCRDRILGVDGTDYPIVAMRRRVPLSKNREATGARQDPLLRWGQTQHLPFWGLDAVEYRRRPSSAPPYFAVRALLRLLPLSADRPLPLEVARSAHRQAMAQQPEAVRLRYQWLARQFSSLPVLAVSYRVPGPFSRWLVTDWRTGKESVLSEETFCRLIGQADAWITRTRPCLFSDYSTWHRASFRSVAYFHDVDLVLGPDAHTQWIEVTRAGSRTLEYTAFAFLARSFALVSLLCQLAEQCHGSASLVVHNDRREVASCSLSRLPLSFFTWVDALCRQRQVFVQTSSGAYRERMGQAARRLFAEHQQDAPFQTFWAQRHLFPSYLAWTHYVLPDAP